MTRVLAADRINSLADELDRRFPRPLDIYVIGGSALALRGRKDSTKDIDLVLFSIDDAKLVRDILEGMGVKVSMRPSDPGHLASTPPTVDIAVDLFCGTICNGLSLSSTMASRAWVLDPQARNAHFRVLSDEDLFLLKSVTERPRDLHEMVGLFRGGLNKDILLQECDVQDRMAKRGERIWELFLLDRLEELERTYSISVSWKGELKRRADIKMGAALMMRSVPPEGCSYADLSKAIEAPLDLVKRCAHYLEENDLISIDRSRKPHRLHKLKEL